MVKTRSAACVACLALGMIAHVGCTSDGGVTYASFYEGLTGDEPAPTPVEAVAMMFNREDADQRRKGVGWLAASSFGGEPEYVASYRLLAADPNPNVRAAAARALGLHGSPEDAQLLSVLLTDEDPLVRWQAADGLRKIHNPAAVPALLDRLIEDNEEDADTRTAVAQALGQYADRIVFNRLAAALEDRSFAVVNAAHQSLMQLTGHDAGLDPGDWSRWADSTPNPFANQRPYTYQPYKPTRDFLDKYVLFWNNQTPGPKTPTGLSQADK